MRDARRQGYERVCHVDASSSFSPETRQAAPVITPYTFIQREMEQASYRGLQDPHKVCGLTNQTYSLLIHSRHAYIFLQTTRTQASACFRFQIIAA